MAAVSAVIHGKDGGIAVSVAVVTALISPVKPKKSCHCNCKCTRCLHTNRTAVDTCMYKFHVCLAFVMPKSGSGRRQKLSLL